MALYNKVYRHLSTSAAITALTSNRIYPVKMPQASSLPAVTYQKVGGDRIYSLAGYSSLENPRLEIDCWSSSYETAHQLSTIIKVVMEAATAFVAYLDDDRDLYEDEVEVHRVNMSFSIWNRE